jgi:hypothetical protein
VNYRKKLFTYAVLFLLLFLLVGIPVFSQLTSNVFYVVTAVDTIGLESGFSNEAAGTVTTVKHTTTLTWTAAVPGSNPIASYNMYRGSKTGGPYAKINAAPILAPTVTYVDTVAPPNNPAGLTAVTN